MPSSLVESCNSLLSKARFNKKNKVPSDNHEPLSMKWAASWSTLVGDLYNYRKMFWVSRQPV